MSKDDFKQIDVYDDDVEINYRRRKVSQPVSQSDETHGFNNVLLFFLMLFCVMGIVVISINNRSSGSNQNNTIIVK